MSKKIVATFGEATFTVTEAMQEVFNEANEQPTDWALRLAAEGLTTRDLARPFVVIWAGARYNETVTDGQRGLTLPQGSAAIQAVTRVLRNVFSADDTPKAPKSSGSADPVAALVRAYAKLTPAQKRAFKASI